VNFIQEHLEVDLHPQPCLEFSVFQLNEDLKQFEVDQISFLIGQVASFVKFCLL